MSVLELLCCGLFDSMQGSRHTAALALGVLHREAATDAVQAVVDAAYPAKMQILEILLSRL